MKVIDNPNDHASGIANREQGTDGIFENPISFTASSVTSTSVYELVSAVWGVNMNALAKSFKPKVSGNS
jgi:hypothetical protein